MPILTSSKKQRDITDSYHSGANSYIVKPVIFENFMKSMQELDVLVNAEPATENEAETSSKRRRGRARRKTGSV